MPKHDGTWRRTLDVSTRSASKVQSKLGGMGVPSLTVLCHSDPRRVGEVASLVGLVSGRSESLSRLQPYFSQPTGGEPRPLADPRLSRQSVIEFGAAANGGIRISQGGKSSFVSVDSKPLTETHRVDRGALEQGVTLVLGKRIALLLHSLIPAAPRPRDFGFIGESPSMLHLRREIERLAGLEFTVLLRGETGTGKELVARALHEAGPRSRNPYVCVNAAAVPVNLAASELFGATRGAFTGAEQGKEGYFQRADGGTLFLDEIGETPADVQVQLLRAIDSGQIQPVGAAQAISVDVRLIAATDLDLENAVKIGEFRAPLFHRLSDCEIELPPLRDRRDDIGRLFSHFLAEALESANQSGQRYAFPRVPAELVARLTTYSWPGNVRQLRGIARKLLVASFGREELQLAPAVERTLAASGSPQHFAEVKIAARPVAEISESELQRVLREHHWSVSRVSEALGVSRPALYRRIQESSSVRKASDLSRLELEDAIQRTGGSINGMVEILEVSRRGLKLRMSALNMNVDPGSG